jgi:hypothetical protein
MGNTIIPEKKYSNLPKAQFLELDDNKVLLLGEYHIQTENSYTDFIYKNKDFFSSWICYTEFNTLIDDEKVSISTSKYKDIFASVIPKDLIRHMSYIDDLIVVLYYLIYKDEIPKNKSNIIKLLDEKTVKNILKVYELFYQVFIDMNKKETFDKTKQELYDTLFEIRHIFTNQDRIALKNEIEKTMQILTSIYNTLIKYQMNDIMVMWMDKFKDFYIVTKIFRYIIDNLFPGQFHLTNKPFSLQFNRDTENNELTSLIENNSEVIKVQSKKFEETIMLLFLYDMIVLESFLEEQPKKLIVICGARHIDNIAYLFRMINFKIHAVSNTGSIKFKSPNLLFFATNPEGPVIEITMINYLL